MKAVSRALKLRPPMLVVHYSFLRANGHVILLTYTFKKEPLTVDMQTQYSIASLLT